MSSAEEVAAELRLLGVTAQGRVSKVVTYHGNLLKSAAMRHASGRPGPNAITGDLRRSIALEVTSTSEKIVATTGTDKVQGPRLEFGFTGTDSLGRNYDQPPYPFLGPALDEIAPAFEQAIAEAGLA